MTNSNACKIDGCDMPVKARGWCDKHYSRWRSNGDPLITQVIIGDDEARFWSKVDRLGDDECWPWGGNVDEGGYGIFKVRGKMLKAHKWAYEKFVRPVPPGMTLDHVKVNGCTRRNCVNYLRHLEIVTGRENTLRGAGPSAVNARKKRCSRGHKFTPENTFTRKGGWRMCRTCHREGTRARRAAKRARTLLPPAAPE
jgi:hypothetical protein